MPKWVVLIQINFSKRPKAAKALSRMVAGLEEEGGKGGVITGSFFRTQYRLLDGVWFWLWVLSSLFFHVLIRVVTPIDNIYICNYIYRIYIYIPYKSRLMGVVASASQHRYDDSINGPTNTMMSLLSALPFRCLGPGQGGKITALASKGLHV